MMYSVAVVLLVSGSAAFGVATWELQVADFEDMTSECRAALL
jgi:hypothetical protein